MYMKRTMALLLALVMMFSLVACGKDKEGEKVDEGNTSVTTPVDPDANQGTAGNNEVKDPDTNQGSENTDIQEPDDTKEPEKVEKPEPIDEADVLAADTGAYIPEYISVADFVKVTDVKSTSILVPVKYYSDSVTYDEYFEAAIAINTVNKKTDPEKYNRLKKIIDNNVVITDKDTFFLANYTDDIIIRSDIMTNNVGWGMEDLTEAQLKYLMGKLNMDEFGDVTISIIDSIPYSSRDKVIAKISNTSTESDATGYLAVALYSDYMATTLVAGDPDKTDLEWMLYTAKSLEITR